MKMKDNLEKKINHETTFHDLTDEEYISMKGNGTAVRFWQLEAEREKRHKSPSDT